jgi:hypothetical protein
MNLRATLCAGVWLGLFVGGCLTYAAPSAAQPRAVSLTPGFDAVYGQAIAALRGPVAATSEAGLRRQYRDVQRALNNIDDYYEEGYRPTAAQDAELELVSRRLESRRTAILQAARNLGISLADVAGNGAAGNGNGVDYVRICSTYGAGFFYIPGTDTCLRVSGFVQAEYQYLEQEIESFDEFGMRGRARINVDARTMTEYGLLRSFIRWDVRRQSGAYERDGEVPGAVGFDVSRMPDQAYVQFAGLTAGRAQSFFDFYTFPDVFTTQRTASDTKTQMFAYTATFGGGWTGTIAAEDAIERRIFDGPLAVPPGFIAPDPVVTSPDRTLAPGGFEWPDLVANLRVDQA